MSEQDTVVYDAGPPYVRALTQDDIAAAVKAERERIAKFIESRVHYPDGCGRGSKELADAVRGMPDA